MHSYLPHPNDRLIILIVSEKFDKVDRQSITFLLESRFRDHLGINLLLEFQHVSGTIPTDWWIHVLGEPNRVGRFAIVGQGEAKIFGENIADKLASTELRFYSDRERGRALSWVRGGLG